MNDATTFSLVAAVLYGIPALVWFSMAYGTGMYLRVRQPRSPLFRILPIVTGVVGLYFLIGAIWALLPPELHRRPTGAVVLLNALDDIALLASVALFQHFLRFVPVRDDPPGWRWLAGNYGVAVLVAAIVVSSRIVRWTAGAEPSLGARVIFLAYLFGTSVLCVRQVARTARGSGWGPAGVVTVRRPDVMVAACGPLVVGTALLVVIASGRFWQPSIWTVLVEVALGLTIAVPTAIRMLGEIVQRFVTAVVMIAALGAVLTVHAAAVGIAGTEFHHLIDLTTVLMLLGVLLPGHAWLRTVVERMVFRRSRLRQAELQDFLSTLAPEAGIHECCRRALAETTRVMQLRAAAILLDDGAAMVEGGFALEPLRQVWLQGAAAVALPTHGFGTAEIRELPPPLREALIEAQVGLGVFPIVSPRRRWGHLFISTTRLDASFTEEDVEVLQAFTAQLALVLDGAQLLDRAIAVERSLAHAEKLAAIGELTARIAHEIRNPVTAARSLAQQLASAPLVAADGECANLILSELQRVERQVAALLRFARRDEFQFEPVDLGELVQATVEHFRPRLEAAGIEVALDLCNGIVARADREKLRQVLVNLIDNAADALGDGSDGKRLAISVAAQNGTAQLRVTDNGPGVAPDAVPHLFEPFFSLKATGTGLGLAIAKRTVDAHGGRIEAAAAPGTGATFRIDLPLATDA